jgi:hypothetical protein
MTEVSDTLRAARKLIEKPENWCQTNYCETVGGVQRCCVFGAVSMAAPNTDVSVTAIRALRTQMGRPGTLEGFNDHPDTTHAMVLDLLTRAIAMEEADG